MRLIDADALIDSLTVDKMECYGCPEPEWMDEIIEILEHAPTIHIKGIGVPNDCLSCKIRGCDKETYLVTGGIPDDCPLVGARSADGMISRAELFNKLAVIHAPMEANEYKAEVYKIINEL